jgi:hypothetical protein
MRGTGGFSIVLLMVGGILILIAMFEGQPWLDAPKVVAPATISQVIGCDTIEGDRICQTKIQRPGKVPQIWPVKLQNEYDVVTQGQMVYRLCWYESAKREPTCFDNAILKPVGPWVNSLTI